MSSYRYQSLFSSLILVLVLAPIFKTLLGALFLNLIFMLLLLSSLYFLSRHTSTLITGALLSIPTLFFSWANYLTPSLKYEIFGLCSYLLFLIVVLGVLIRSVYRFDEAKTDLLYGAVSIYLLFGITWGFGYELLEVLQPGSFDGFKMTEDVNFRFFDTCLYFSFVTLTTLGYGDIVPVTSLARVFSAIEAIVGQFYIAILVSSLVGLVVLQRRKS